MCFALHDICVLHPFSNLVFEILLGSMFIEVCHSKARHCRYSFDVFTCIYIYMHIYIYFCLMLVYVHLYTSFHVEGERGGNSQSEIPM